MFTMAKDGGAIGAVILLFVLAAITGRRRNKKLKKLLQAEVARFEEEQAALAASGDKPALPAGANRPELERGPGGRAAPDAAELAHEERQREIASLVEQQPDEVATLLRGWLADRRA